ncbi:hypothetical protein PIB30_090592 [Stylosanthes scabra]|uniref:Uncharacterized protein n=1 Tax=Stylosanthes scabra TaxID=79078 RepID=A0ABU6WXM0_9FABA|nr:hypothetical protein [Stylosanthes scabra]
METVDDEAVQRETITHRGSGCSGHGRRRNNHGCLCAWNLLGARRHEDGHDCETPAQCPPPPHFTTTTTPPVVANIETSGGGGGGVGSHSCSLELWFGGNKWGCGTAVDDRERID